MYAEKVAVPCALVAESNVPSMSPDPEPLHAPVGLGVEKRPPVIGEG